MKQQGFILVEIIMVSLIIGVVAVLAIPLTLNFERQVVIEYEAERFIADYRHLQTVAKLSTPDTIQMSVRNDGYSCIDNNPNKPSQAIKHKFNPQVTAACQGGNSNRLIVFQTNGEPKSGMTIILASSNSKFKRSIIISRGRIRMERQ